MKIKDYKDFWSGIMFLAFGLLAVYLAQSYNMGTSARMGPGYFPAVLGGLLALMGLWVLLASISFSPSAKAGEKQKGLVAPLVVLIGMMLFSMAAGGMGASPNAALALGTLAGCALAFFMNLRAMSLILLGITIFGLLLKGLGLVLSTLILIGIGSMASHEMKRKEAVISAVLLAAFAVLVFIYGIKLQLPIWPDLPELERQFMPQKKS
jgi:heme A synthase